MKERTVAALRELPTRGVYAFLANEDICRKFYAQAENEGYRFGETKPTDMPVWDIVAIEKEHRLLCAGFVGHMAFVNPNQYVGGLSRVDYAKYIAGDEEYLMPAQEANKTRQQIPLRILIC